MLRSNSRINTAKNRDSRVIKGRRAQSRIRHTIEPLEQRLFLSATPSGTTLLNDQFTSDAALNTSLWQLNGPIATTAGENLSSPSATIIQPQLSFSSSTGMDMLMTVNASGATPVYEADMIQSVQSFSGPFTAQAQVTGIVSHGNTFVFMVYGSNSSNVEIMGNLNPGNGPYYGINEEQNFNQNLIQLVSNPSVNTPYTLSIGVDASGNTTLTVASGGQTLASTSGNKLGTGPFYVLIGQLEGYPYTAGNNEAQWNYVQVSGSTGTLLPSVAITTPSGPQADNIPINYVLTDADSDPCSVSAQYSPDGGTTWLTATPGSGGDGTTGLTSSPGGTSHTFVWASATDLPGISNGNVEYRITPSSASGSGSAATTGTFVVDNTLHITAVPPKQTPGAVLTTSVIKDLGAVPGGDPNEAQLGVNNELDLWVPFTYAPSSPAMHIQSYQDTFGFDPLFGSLGVLPPNGTWQFTADFPSPSSSIYVVPQGGATAETPYLAATILNLCDLIPNLVDIATDAPVDPLTLLGFPTTPGGLASFVSALENNSGTTPAPEGFIEASQLLTAAAVSPLEMAVAAPLAAGDIASVFTDPTGKQQAELANIIASATGNTPSTILDKIPEISVLHQLQSSMIYLGTELVNLYQVLTTGGSVAGDAIYTAVSATQPPAVTNIRSNSATVTWQPPSVPATQNVTYTVCYDTPGDWWANSVSTSNSSTTLTSLVPGSKYEFWVLATTNLGGVQTSSAIGSGTFATAGAAPVSQLSISMPSHIITAGAPFTLTVTIEDQNGNILTIDNSNVTVALSPDPVLYGTTTVTAINGVATFTNLWLNVSGNFSFVATDAADGLTASAPSTPITVTPAAATDLAFIQQPVNTTAGNKISPALTVAVEDQFGNVLTTDNSYVTLRVVGGSSTDEDDDGFLSSFLSRGFGPIRDSERNGQYGDRFHHALTVKMQNGVATFANLSFDRAGEYSLKATDCRLASATSSSFTVTPAAAVRMVFLDVPAFNDREKTFDVTVALFDKYGNLATNDTSSVTLSLAKHPKNGTLAGTLTAPVVNGIADFDNLSVNEEGLYTLVASDSGGIPAITSGPFLVGDWKFGRVWDCSETRI